MLVDWMIIIKYDISSIGISISLHGDWTFADILMATAHDLCTLPLH